MAEPATRPRASHDAHERGDARPRDHVDERRDATPVRRRTNVVHVSLLGHQTFSVDEPDADAIDW